MFRIRDLPRLFPDLSGQAMLRATVNAASAEIRLARPADLAAQPPEWRSWVLAQGHVSPSRLPQWLAVLARGLRHEPYCLEAVAGGRTVGLLPLALVRSLWFGRFLVGLPYLNVGGVLAESNEAAMALVDRAARLADELNVRHLELRHEEPIEHPALGERLTSKVHMRLALPESADELWAGFDPKVRNQVRKGERHKLSIHWGRHELLGDFYGVFARNMRDLGTPVFSRRLFESILTVFPAGAWYRACT
jgi:FemAB-related protein (PEP-CTERM system-associated)